MGGGAQHQDAKMFTMGEPNTKTPRCTKFRGGWAPRPSGPPVPCEHTALGSLWRGVAIANFLLGFRVDQGKSLNCTYLDSFLVDQGKSLNCTHGVAASPPAQSVCQSARSRLPVSNHELKKTLHQVLAITRGVGWCGSLDDGAG